VSVGKIRTALAGVVADGDDIVEPLLHEAVDGLGLLGPDVDARLRHDLDGQGVEHARLRARARGLDGAAREVAQEPLGHLTAGGVVGADEEDLRSLSHGFSALGVLIAKAGPLVSLES
jgi:hypothetical protein